MQRYFTHRDRYVVATSEDSTGAEKVSVEFVGLHPQVSGLSRRGRTPKYAKAVPVSELEEITDESVLAQFAQEAPTQN